MNRGIFAFNEGLDAWVVEPAARGWKWAVPKRVQWSIRNVLDNGWIPAVFANHLLQGRPGEAFGKDLPRLLVNTTVGLGGLFDVASKWGIKGSHTDFGVTLGRWGLPPGPYLVLPLLGPSSVRDGSGRVADAFSSPYGYFIPVWGFVIVRGVELMNLRAIYFEEIAQSRADAFDFYLFMRSAWLQNRRHRVREARGDVTSASSPDGTLPQLEGLDQAEDADDLYYLDDDDDDYEGNDSEDALPADDA